MFFSEFSYYLWGAKFSWMLFEYTIQDLWMAGFLRQSIRKPMFSLSAVWPHDFHCLTCRFGWKFASIGTPVWMLTEFLDGTDCGSSELVDAFGSDISCGLFTSSSATLFCRFWLTEGSSTLWDVTARWPPVAPTWTKKRFMAGGLFARLFRASAMPRWTPE